MEFQSSRGKGAMLVLVALALFLVLMGASLSASRQWRRTSEGYIGGLPTRKAMSENELLFHHINDWYLSELGRPVDPVLANYYLHQQKLLLSSHDDDDEKNSREFFENDVLRSLVEYKTKVDKAKDELLKDKSVVFAGLLRDNEDRIFGIADLLDPIIRTCKEYKIVILENNSKDRTRDRLLKWAKNDPNIVILCHSPTTFNDDQCHLTGSLFEWSRYDGDVDHRKNSFDKLHQRTYKMSLLRNLILDAVRQNFSGYDFLFVIDFDLHGCLFSDGIFHSFEYLCTHPEVDGIVGNGMNIGTTSSPFTLADLRQETFDVSSRFANRVKDVPFYYYDTFAYIEKGALTTYFFHDSIRNTHHDYVFRYMTTKYTESMAIDPVHSAFGGAAIYRMGPALKNNYFILPNHAAPFVNSGLFTEIETSSWKVECEHTSFHQNMNLVLNPRMVFFILKNP